MMKYDSYKPYTVCPYCRFNSRFHNSPREYPEIVKAILNGDVDKVNLLVNDCNAFYCTGFLLLGLAANNNQIEIMQILIDRGVNVNLCDGNKNTALFYCSSLKSAELLIKHGANINHRNCYGQTPLLFLAMRNDVASEKIKSIVGFYETQGLKKSDFDFYGHNFKALLEIHRVEHKDFGPFPDDSKNVDGISCLFSQSLNYDLSFSDWYHYFIFPTGLSLLLWLSIYIFVADKESVIAITLFVGPFTQLMLLFVFSSIDLSHSNRIFENSIQKIKKCMHLLDGSWIINGSTFCIIGFFANHHIGYGWERGFLFVSILNCIGAFILSKIFESKWWLKSKTGNFYKRINEIKSLRQKYDFPTDDLPF